MDGSNAMGQQSWQPLAGNLGIRPAQNCVRKDAATLLYSPRTVCDMPMSLQSKE